MAYLTGRHAAASRAYRDAFELDTTRFGTTACWLINALLACQEESAHAAAEAFDSAFERGHSLVQQVVDTQSRDRMKRSEKSHEALGRRLLHRVGGASREVLNAAI